MTRAHIARLERLAAAGRSDVEIAAALGVSPRTVIRWRQAYGIRSQWTPATPPCGTLPAYRRGCRCDRCRAASAAARRAHRRARAYRRWAADN